MTAVRSADRQCKSRMSTYVGYDVKLIAKHQTSGTICPGEPPLYKECIATTSEVCRIRANVARYQSEYNNCLGTRQSPDEQGDFSTDAVEELNDRRPGAGASGISREATGEAIDVLDTNQRELSRILDESADSIEESLNDMVESNRRHSLGNEANPSVDSLADQFGSQLDGLENGVNDGELSQVENDLNDALDRAVEAVRTQEDRTSEIGEQPTQSLEDVEAEMQSMLRDIEAADRKRAQRRSAAKKSRPGQNLNADSIRNAQCEQICTNYHNSCMRAMIAAYCYEKIYRPCAASCR